MDNEDVLDVGDEIIKEISKDEKEDITDLINSCNSFSEMIDKLCIENIRLWHILDDTVLLKNKLERQDITKTERIEILEKIAKKSFENIEVVKRRSIFKNAIDEIFVKNVREIIENKDINKCTENKSYGRIKD